MKLAGWGRFPKVETTIVTPHFHEDIREQVLKGSLIARGNGRSYGDSAVNKDTTLHMKRLNKMISFNPADGQLVAQAGVMLADVINTFLPRGWFPFVTPGTKFVTLGGMAATDVHGKNHHSEGSFVQHIDWIDLMTPDGRVRRCSRQKNAKLFHWTIGGMGLTGVILTIACRLRKVSTSFIRQNTIAAQDLYAAIEVFEQTLSSTYAVAWIDCLGRGRQLGRSLIMLGEHAQQDELPDERQNKPFDIPRRKSTTVPFELPSLTLNRWSVGLFNSIYYWIGARRPRHSLIDYETYFYPLDTLHGWNKIYGRRGFAQFQCAIPLGQSPSGLKQILETVSQSSSGAFLAVLKRFGPSAGYFSFPIEGYTLSLDFPVTPKNLTFLKQLDNIAIRHGGKFYLAKDSRIPMSTYHLSHDNHEGYIRFLAKHDRGKKIKSEQSKRLGL